MSQNGIPDGAGPTTTAPAHTGILDHLEQLAERFLGRQNDAPAPVYDDPAPVVEHRLASPPYAGMTPEVMGRYQQETFVISLTAAAPSATLNIRTRCDYYSIAVYPRVAAGTNDPANGVWVGVSGTPPVVPAPVAGVPMAATKRVWLGQPLQLHGGEQTLSFTLDSAVDLNILVFANTNVPIPYQ